MCARVLLLLSLLQIRNFAPIHTNPIPFLALNYQRKPPLTGHTPLCSVRLSGQHAPLFLSSSVRACARAASKRALRCAFVFSCPIARVNKTLCPSLVAAFKGTSSIESVRCCCSKTSFSGGAHTRAQGAQRSDDVGRRAAGASAGGAAYPAVRRGDRQGGAGERRRGGHRRDGLRQDDAAVAGAYGGRMAGEWTSDTHKVDLADACFPASASPHKHPLSLITPHVQILLEAGFGKEGIIGVTQPRRVVSRPGQRRRCAACALGVVRRCWCCRAAAPHHTPARRSRQPSRPLSLSLSLSLLILSLPPPTRTKNRPPSPSRAASPRSAAAPSAPRSATRCASRTGARGARASST